jgi:hypothetical protein
MKHNVRCACFFGQVNRCLVVSRSLAEWTFVGYPFMLVEVVICWEPRVEEFRIAKDNWDLAFLTPHFLCQHYDLHLKGIFSTLDSWQDFFQHIMIIQAKASRQIRRSWIFKKVCQKVGTPAGNFPFQIPSINTTFPRNLSCTRHNFNLILLHHLYHGRNVLLWMMG